MPVLLNRFRNPHRGSCPVHWTTPSSTQDCGYSNLKLAIPQHHSETLLVQAIPVCMSPGSGTMSFSFCKDLPLAYLATSLTVAVPAWISLLLCLWYKWHRHCFHACFRPRCGCGVLKGETFASGFTPSLWNQHLCNLCQPQTAAFSTASLGYSSRQLSLGFSVLVKVEHTLSVVRVVDIVGESHAQVSLTLKLYLIFEIHTSCSCVHDTLSTPLEISDGVICCCHCLTSAWPTGLSLAFETINVKSITWYP